MGLDERIARAVASAGGRQRIESKSFRLNHEKYRNLREWERLYYTTIRGEGFLQPPPDRCLMLDGFYQNYALVHMIRDRKSVLFQGGVEQIVSSWDIVSCSLIRLTPPGDETIADVGFAIRVPPQNIVGAHRSDVWVANHVGADYRRFRDGKERAARAGLLVGALLSDATLKGHVMRLNVGVQTLTDVRSPMELMARERGHNEVIACGRSNIQFYDFGGIGLGPENRFPSTTDEIKLRFIVINPFGPRIASALGKGRHSLYGLYENYWKLAKALRRVNVGSAIKVVQCRAPHWDWSKVRGARACDGFI